MWLRFPFALLVWGTLAFAQLSESIVVDTPGFLYRAYPVYFQNCQCWHGRLAKYAPTGDRLIWSRDIQGEGEDRMTALVLDSDGNPIVALSTSSKTLPVTSGAYSSKPTTLYLAKFSADGQSLLAATYFGGSAPFSDYTPSEETDAMKVDGHGNIVLAGSTVSFDFPTTAGVVQRNPDPTLPDGWPAGMCTSPSDQFVSSFDSGLSKLRFSTRLGGGLREVTGGLAIGSDGSLYVSGTRGTERLCEADPFLVRLTPDASAIIYRVSPPDATSTPTAGPLYLDSGGNAYFSGDSRAWGLGPQHATLWRVDAAGKVTATSPVQSLVREMGMTPDGVLFVTGTAPWGVQTNGPVGCPGPQGVNLTAPSITAFDAVTLAVKQVRFTESDATGVDRAGNAITSGAVVNLVPAMPANGAVTCAMSGAKFQAVPIAPGEVISLFGPDLGLSIAQSGVYNADGSVVTSMGGITVKVDGRAAPLLYVGPNQINLVAPFEIAPDSAVRIEIWRDGALQSGINKWVTARDIGMFRIGDPSANQFAALNQDGSVNGADNPAAAGSIVSLFGTGFGQMTPQPVDGSRPAGAVSVPVLPVVVGVGYDVATAIQYVGNAPTLVQGVVQINVVVPTNAATGILSLFLAPSAGSWQDAGTIFVRR